MAAPLDPKDRPGEPVAPWRRPGAEAVKNERLEAARLYARRFGWRLFPVHGIRPGGSCTCGNPQCARAGKHPATAHGLLDASNNPERLRAWWTEMPWANLGLATGRDPYTDADRPAGEGPVTQPVNVIDADVRAEKGLDGLEILTQLAAQHGEVPDTATSLTGGGGQQLFFAYPEGVGKVKSSTNTLGPGLDVRGDGGYVILPPSLHASLRAYQWEAASDPTEGVAFARMPAWLVERVRADRTSGRATTRTVDVSTIVPPDESTVVELRAALTHVGACDYQRWIEVGMALHAAHPGGEMLALWDEWSQRCPEKHAPGACEAKWRSFHVERKFAGGLDYQSVFHWAAEAGWANPRAGSARPEGAAVPVDTVRITVPANVIPLPVRPGAARKVRQSAGASLLALHPLPEHLYRLPGALQGAVDWYNRTAPKPQPLFAVAAAIAIGSIALGRYWRTTNRNYSSLWLMCVGESGCGKEWLKTVIETVLSAAGLEQLINLGGYTSQGAVFSALQVRPAHLTLYDEAGRYLQAMSGLRQSSHEINAWTTLMEAWGRCDGVMAPPQYSKMALNERQREQLEEVKVLRPAVSILAMTTPDSLYEALTPDLVKDGFLGRWTVVETEVGLQAGWKIAHSDSPPDTLVEWVRLARTLPLAAGNLAEVMQDDPRVVPEPRVVPISAGAEALVNAMAETVLDRRADGAKWGFSEAWGRSVETAIKLGLILAASESIRAPVIEERHVAWARDWVWHNTVRLEARAKDRMVGGRIAKEVVRLKDYVFQAGEMGVTFREIRRRFKGWDAMTMKQALQSLIDGREVALAQIRTAGRPREAYVVVEGCDE